MAVLNIIAAIRERADPAAIALVQSQRQLTYRELFDRCDAIAATLPQQGQPLRIGVHYPSGIDYVPIAMAVLAAGHCFVPVPDELAPSERTELIQRTALNAMIGPDGELRALDAFDAPFPLDDFAALNPAFIRFSSGTTGKSKGVVLSHESLLARITAANEGLCIGPGDRVLWVLPMAHHFAVSIVLYLYHGATTIIEEHHLGEDLLRAGSVRRATVMYGSPVHYRQLAAAPGDATWPSLRLAVSTASALDQATADLFRARFHQPLVQGLGIIEVGLPLLNFDAPTDQAEAIGKPLPAYQCKLLDPHEGVGELCLRGPGMFDAYLDPWQPRSQVLDSEGWFATGDLARCDADGRVFLCGRRKSLINVGGMKVFPEEVERVLDAHPLVQRSLVEGRAHSLFGEVPVARYVIGERAPTLAELRAHCREHLANYKIPLMFSAVPSLPMTASGKLLRRGSAEDSPR
jgi:long-chain acyl-CoA synthetase